VTLLDASALLAFLLGEPGAEIVEQALADEPACTAINWSETAQMALARGRDWDLACALLKSYGIDVLPVVEADGEWAAHRWRRGEELCLADRLCLAVGERLDARILTADRVWGSDGRIEQIR
jgi:PIN domain nuclease of toxin-antitoxin system